MFGLIRESKLSEKFEKIKNDQKIKDKAEEKEKIEEMTKQFEFEKKLLIASHNAEIKSLEDKISEYKIKLKQSQEVWQWCRSQTQSNKMISSELSLAVAEMHMSITEIMRKFAHIEDNANEYQENFNKAEIDHKKQLGLLGTK